MNAEQVPETALKQLSEMLSQLLILKVQLLLFQYIKYAGKKTAEETDLTITECIS